MWAHDDPAEGLGWRGCEGRGACPGRVELGDSGPPQNCSNHRLRRLLTSVGTLAQWRYLRRGPAYIKVGRSVAYRLSDLLDYVEQTRVSHNGVAA